MRRFLIGGPGDDLVDCDPWMEGVTVWHVIKKYADRILRKKDNEQIQGISGLCRRVKACVLFAVISAVCLAFSVSAADSTQIYTDPQMQREGPGGVEIRQEGPGGVEIRQEGPGGVEIRQEGPGGAEIWREGPGGVEIRQEGPGGAEIRQEGPDGEKTHIRILCIGNSFSQDCIAYMPFIVQNLTDNISVTLGIAYNHGAGIDDYIGFFNDDTASITYNKKSPDKDEWISTRNQTIRQVLADEDWDIVTFQQNSARQEDWSSYSGSNELIHDVVGYIAVTHNKEAQVGWLMPQVRYKAAGDDRFEDLVKCMQRVLETTSASFVIPCGTAVHYARRTGLREIGDGGGLTHDGVHLQEGLPCLLAAYVSTLKIMEICGIECLPVFADQTRPVQDWVDIHNIPGQNGTSVGVTDENCFLAQNLASKAIEYPYGENK